MSLSARKLQNAAVSPVKESEYFYVYLFPDSQILNQIMDPEYLDSAKKWIEIAPYSDKKVSGYQLSLRHLN
jgi:hypothetical protein